ncbi:hypothetical protein NPX13_g6659 [Xylaria arbuscula]|uniref:Uncharacterized protein n=1 Tax=Xylaria arbuscula TaxID=114810 RepID=A0A9W8NC68_9PEZI|nr:hypothetical protein NPX13_g6659 [Xylaria arbuscula]
MQGPKADLAIVISHDIVYNLAQAKLTNSEYACSGTESNASKQDIVAAGVLAISKADEEVDRAKKEAVANRRCTTACSPKDSDIEKDDSIQAVYRTGSASADTVLGNAHLNASTPIGENLHIPKADNQTDSWEVSIQAVVPLTPKNLVWDAIISLLSREDCVFPHTYFEATISNDNWETWDYFRLCGCPLPLVRMVMQLARLSAEKSKATSMRYVKFDDAVISEIEKALETWQHVSPPNTLQDEATLHQDMDTMHCCEAWRNGLLLYLYRVFQWEPGEPVSIQATLRARILTDHIFACREDSLVAKQALLPLFFAGCELRDEPTRKKIVRYCAIWDDMTRYHMFNSTIPLLKEVWADQEQKGFDNVWWGQVVDRRHAAESRDALQMRICFG